MSTPPKKKNRGGARPGAGAPLGSKNALGNKSKTGQTDYRPEFIDEMIKFFDIEPYRTIAYESTKEYFANGDLKKTSEKLKEIPNKLPTLYRFAKHIGVTYSAINDWRQKGEELDEDEKPKHPEFVLFAKTYAEAKEMQKEFLITIGLAGAAPPAAYIFTAKNVTDMRDRIEQDLTSKGKELGVTYLPPLAPPPTEETK